MELAEYDRIAALEDAHWRYRAVRRSVALALRRHERRSGAPLGRILDAGCGTGGTLRALAALAPGVGVDLHPRALALARARGARGLARADVARLPFASASFGAVVSIDVLYHQRVGDDAAALEELARVCRPGGAVVLWLPAYDWLRSAHDAVVHTARRYTRARVRALAADAGLEVAELTYLHAPILAAALLVRGLERVRAARAARRGGSAPPESALAATPRGLDTLLYATLAAEDSLAARVPLPFGLSLLAVLTAERSRRDRA